MTHPIKGIVAVSAAALFLSGCELFTDTSTSDVVDTTDIEDITTAVVTAGGGYDEQVIQTLDLFRVTEGMSDTPSDQMPVTGSATYEGVVGFSYVTPTSNIAAYDVMSDLSLQTDFETGAVTGSMDNFNTVDDVTLDGNLTLTEGEIQGTNFTANAIGVFTEDTTAEIWDLDIVADFMGASGVAIEGTANGTISNGGSESTEVFGDMIAQQN